VWYKREFEWLDVLTLWERLWTDYLSSNFHLFIALAILEKHRNVIMEHLQHFDEVLKYVNELSNTIDLESTLIRAEALFRRFQRTVEAIDKKSNFPAPKLRHRVQNASIGSTQSLRSPPTSPGATANTSGTDTVTAGATNSGAGPSSPGRPAGRQSVYKGKAKAKEEGELEDQRPKVISQELRDLLSRKVEVLPRKVVAKTGEGFNSLGKDVKK